VVADVALGSEGVLFQRASAWEKDIDLETVLGWALGLFVLAIEQGRKWESQKL